MVLNQTVIINSCVMMILLFTKASLQCSRGEIRLVNGNGSREVEGRVEACVDNNWGKICADRFWGNADAQVFCKILGYTPEGAMKLSFQREAGPILLDKIRCDANRDITLFECNPQFMPGGNCDFEAGVRCRNDQRVKTINAAIMMSSTGSITASINWELQNITMDEPRLFKVNCFNDWHSIAISVDNKTFTTNLGNLFPFSSYTCCLSAVYELYTAKGICTEIKTPELFVNHSTTEIPEILSNNNMASNSSKVVGGVLGFIIVILLILLTISGVAVAYLFQSRRNGSTFLPRLSGSVARNTATDMPAPVHSNLSYVITPSHSTIRSSRALPTAGAATAMNHDQAQCPDYSCLGPDYEIVDSSGQSQGKHAAQATSQSRRLSQRYEYSEVHLAADSGATASTHYEVPLNLRQNETKENEDYSHLKH